MTKVQALLTDDQKKAWQELTGEPIEIQYPRGRPGGRITDRPTWMGIGIPNLRRAAEPILRRFLG